MKVIKDYAQQLYVQMLGFLVYEITHPFYLMLTSGDDAEFLSYVIAVITGWNQ